MSVVVFLREFLKRGYAVIFLHRERSITPFYRVASDWSKTWVDTPSTPTAPSAHGTGEFARLAVHVASSMPRVTGRCHSGAGGQGHGGHCANLSQGVSACGVYGGCHGFVLITAWLVLARHGREQLRKDNRIMFVPFTTVSNYLFMLREAGKALRPAGRTAMMYLAAAVSDFYVPESEMVGVPTTRWLDTSTRNLTFAWFAMLAQAVHKIQSTGGTKTLDLSLRPVPKMLHLVSGEWCPHALNVSFKVGSQQCDAQHRSVECASYVRML